MKLHWFSPLPPVASEIASFTARLLPELAARTAVTLWTDQPGWDGRLEQWAGVRQYQPGRLPWAELNDDDALAVYHIGNHAGFHRAIYEVSQQHPGLVVLHDTHLHHLFYSCFVDAGRTDDYRDAMRRQHGLEAVDELDELIERRISSDQLAQRYAMTELAVETALGVLVHARTARAQLGQSGQQPVVFAALPHDAGPLPPPAAAGPPYRLIVFGHLGSNRRLEPLLHALACHPARTSFRLDIFGRLSDEARVRWMIADLNLAKSVAIHGYVSATRLREALAAAHLAINLRHPTMGEASASQLLIWEYALPSLLTPAGWYAEQPEEAVLFMRTEHEQTDIHAALDGLLADSARFRRMGEAGRRHLERHHPSSQYVDALLRAAELCRERHTTVVAERLAQRLAANLADCCFPHVPDVCRRKLAEQLDWLAG